MFDNKSFFGLGACCPRTAFLKGFSALFAALLSTSCSAQMTADETESQPRNETILVYFDADKCPTGVDKNTITATRVNPPTRVFWKDAGLNNVPPTEDPADFEVIFTPFNGPKIHGNGGQTNGDNILSDAPTVLFKYTIVGTQCTDSAKKNYDPYIRVL